MGDGWCRNCGHMERMHREPAPACMAMALVGRGEGIDGGLYAPCLCSGFEPIAAAAEAPA